MLIMKLIYFLTFISVVAPLLFSLVNGALLASPGRIARRKDYKFIRQLVPSFVHKELNPVYVWAPKGKTKGATSHTNSVAGLFGMFHVILTQKTPFHRLRKTQELRYALQKHEKGILVLPGGKTSNLKWVLCKDTEVAREIHQAVKDGWVVLGVCAGAYIMMDAFYTHEKRRKGLGIVDGIALPGIPDMGEDPIPMDVTLADPEAEGDLTTVYFEGPILQPDGPFKTIATFAGDTELNGKPSIVSVEIGKGRVILSPVHFESVFLRCSEWEENYTAFVDQHGPNLNDLQHDPDTCKAPTDTDNMLECGICHVENMVLTMQLIDLIFPV